MFETGQGRSGTFANAQGNQTAPQDVAFFVYRVRNYQVMTIDNELIEAAASDAGAFVDGFKLAFDTSMRNLTNDLAADLFRDGSGTRGQISAITSGVITLVDPNSIVQFAVGMSLVSFSVSGSTLTQPSGGAIGYVIARNVYAGTITVSTSQGGSAATPTNWTTSFPNLAVQGDTVATTAGATLNTGTALKITGFASWLNSPNIQAGESFWNVDRSKDPTRLGGLYFDGSGAPIEDALIDASNLLFREGGKPDFAIMNVASFSNLEKSLGAKVQYVQVMHDEAEIGWRGITIASPSGPITVLADRNCQTQTCYLLQMNTWKLRSLGKAPHVLRYGVEGLEGIRSATADSLEVRMGYYGNLICRAPGWNCVVKLVA